MIVHSPESIVHRMCAALAVGICALYACAAQATEFYVSPTGTAQGDGSINNPWDLQAALSDNTNSANKNFVVKQGDTIYLREGVYTPATGTIFNSSLLGGVGNNITIRPFPREHVIIQGGIYQYLGGYATFRDLEITGSQNIIPNRVSAQTGSPTDIPLAEGFSVIQAPGLKIINNLIHDAVGDGIYVNAQCPGIEIYGNIIYHNGWDAPDRTHGHSLYLQNSDPTMTIKDNIIFSAFNLGIQAYGSHAAVLDITFDSNIEFNEPFLLGAVTPEGGMKVINNVFGENNHPMFYYANKFNQDLTVTNNQFMEGTQIFWWKPLVLQNNNFYAGLEIRSQEDGDISTYSVSQNRYFNSSFPPTLMTTPGQYTYSSFCPEYSPPCIFQAWLSVGFDTQGSYPSSLPATPTIIINPNQYDPSRYYIAVLNWLQTDTVPVDLSSSLAVGERYEIRDVQNYLGNPVVKGTYAGGTVNLPMNLSAIDAYRGDFTGAYHPIVINHTSLKFGVFVLLKTPGAEFFAAPNGSVSGDGSKTNPWDLQTAFTGGKGKIKPGDTVWLRGGTYAGPLTSTLSGTAALPITVRAYQGEKPIVDDSYHTTLTQGIGTADDSVTLADEPNLLSAEVIQIDSEQMEVVYETTVLTYRVARGWNGTAISAHPAGVNVIKAGDIIQSTGNYVWWWGFEITSIRPERLTNQGYKGSGLNLYNYTQGNKAINMVIHDVGHPAIGFWNQGDGGEVYGCILWGNGLYDNSNPDNGPNGQTRGDGIYAQNQNGNVAIKDTIAFKNFTYGLKAYGEGAYANGFTFSGDVAFNNPLFNIYAGTTKNPITGLHLIENYTYGNPDVLTYDGINIGYTALNNVDAQIMNNYLVEGTWSLVIREFQQAKVQGNTIIGGNQDQEMVLLQKTGGFSSFNYLWDNNSYYDRTGQADFGYTGHPGKVSFADWKTQTGYDANSLYTGAYPTQNAIFVRPNTYESGRGHIIVYNWQKLNSVSIDISNLGLVNGDQFEVRDAQNYLGTPVLTGTYTGSPITLPMDLTAVTPILGSQYITHFDTNAHTDNRFNVFVVMKTASGSILFGDVSGDNQVTAYDAALTVQDAGGLITFAPTQVQAGDMDGNGSITAYDAALIAQKAGGLITKFPVEG